MRGPVVVWGAGAIGGALGAALVRAGHDVLLVDLVAEHVAAIREQGLGITGPVEDYRVAAAAALPEELSGPLGTVLLCVKAHHTETAVREIAPRLSAEGVIVSVQNGLNEEVIARIVGGSRTFGCFVNFGADYLEPGLIHYGGRGTVVVGEVDGSRTARAAEIHALFRDFEPRAVLSTNVMGYLWSKLAYASMLFATALSDEGIADALARHEHRRLYAALAREVVAVAAAEGVRLEAFDGFDPIAFAAAAEPADAERSLDGLVRHNRGSAKTHSGIWRDLAIRHRPTEVDAQLGPVVARGARAGVPTPLNERLVRMIHEVEAGTLPQGVAAVELLAAALPAEAREA